MWSSLQSFKVIVPCALEKRGNDNNTNNITVSLANFLLKLGRAAEWKKQAIAVSDDKGKSWIAASIKTHSSLKFTKQKTGNVLNSQETNQQHNEHIDSQELQI